MMVASAAGVRRAVVLPWEDPGEAGAGGEDLRTAAVASMQADMAAAPERRSGRRPKRSERKRRKRRQESTFTAPKMPVRRRGELLSAGPTRREKNCGAK